MHSLVADYVTTQRQQRCIPDRKETREFGDRKQDKASERIDCTEPLLDSSDDKRNTSSDLSLKQPKR
jgi:hypothetical protein